MGLGMIGAVRDVLVGVLDRRSLLRALAGAAESTAHRVRQFTAEGDIVRVFGSQGGGAGELDFPIGVATVENGFLVADSRNGRLHQFRATGTPAPLGGHGTTVGRFDRPSGMATGSGGVVYVADSSNNRIQRLTPIR